MAATFSLPFWADRAIVAFMRRCHIYARAQPPAFTRAVVAQLPVVALASDIGTLEWVGSRVEANLVALALPDRQTWWPNWIERRILAAAISDWLRQRFENTSITLELFGYRTDIKMQSH